MNELELARTLAKALTAGDESARPALVDLLLEVNCPHAAEHLRANSCHYGVDGCKVIHPLVRHHDFKTVEEWCTE